jgi:hypothetical protein
METNVVMQFGCPLASILLTRAAPAIGCRQGTKTTQHLVIVGRESQQRTHTHHGLPPKQMRSKYRAVKSTLEGSLEDVVLAETTFEDTQCRIWRLFTESCKRKELVAALCFVYRCSAIVANLLLRSALSRTCATPRFARNGNGQVLTYTCECPSSPHVPSKLTTPITHVGRVGRFQYSGLEPALRVIQKSYVK